MEAYQPRYPATNYPPTQNPITTNQGTIHIRTAQPRRVGGQITYVSNTPPPPPPSSALNTMAMPMQMQPPMMHTNQQSTPEQIVQTTPVQNYQAQPVQTMQPAPRMVPAFSAISTTSIASSSSVDGLMGVGREIGRIAAQASRTPIERFDEQTQQKLAGLIKDLATYVASLNGIVDTVDMYANERLMSKPGALTPFSDISVDYNVWCKNKNHRLTPASDAKLRALLESRGLRKASSKGKTVYVDVTVPSSSSMMQ